MPSNQLKLRQKSWITDSTLLLVKPERKLLGNMQSYQAKVRDTDCSETHPFFKPARSKQGCFW